MNKSQADAQEQFLAGMSSTRLCELVNGSRGEMDMTEVTPLLWLASDQLQI